MKRLIYLIIFMVAMVGLPSCDDEEGLNTPEPIGFCFEVFNSAGEDLIANGKIYEMFPDLKVIYNGESHPLDGKNSQFRIIEPHKDNPYYYMEFGWFQVETNKFVIDWGDGTTNTIDFVIDWRDVYNSYASVDGEHISRFSFYMGCFTHRFIK